MIRRAQAEALLKLAEALEECERNGLEIYYDEGQEIVVNESQFWPLRSESLVGADVRVALSALYPK